MTTPAAHTCCAIVEKHHVVCRAKNGIVHTVGLNLRVVAVDLLTMFLPIREVGDDNFGQTFHVRYTSLHSHQGCGRLLSAFACIHASMHVLFFWYIIHTILL